MLINYFRASLTQNAEINEYSSNGVNWVMESRYINFTS